MCKPSSTLSKTSLIPTLMLLVSFHQLFMVNKNLSRWKGGGFGMYSEIHFNENQIWIIDKGRGQEKIGVDNFQLSPRAEAIRKDVIKFPTKRMLKKLYQEIALEGSATNFSIQVWRPRYHLSKSELNRELLIQYP